MTEIERKFLVAQVPVLEGLAAEPIRQGYLTAAADSVELRVRQAGEGYFLTLKSAGGLVRAEHEVAITAAQFAALWPATEGRRVEKVRHRGALPGGLVYELDVFGGALAGLVLVEVEFGSEAAARAFVAPGWFGADVTEDRRYKNKALAQGAP